jgi:SAM-dependent methyltransferase
MDFFDVAWNLFRKNLTGPAYDWCKNSCFGRTKLFVPTDYFRKIADEYASICPSFHNKKILEVGPGKQFYTGFHFLARGAQSVCLADPVFSGCGENQLEHDREEFMRCEKTHVAERSGIQWYSSMDAIPTSENGMFDIICSHFVLEHIMDIDDFFQQSVRLLKPGGVYYHVVDLSDHAYHLFDNRPCTRWLYRSRMLHHLQYSNLLYNFITDNRIWVNRLLFPAYRLLIDRFNLKVQRFNQLFFQKVTIHRDVLEKNPTSNMAELFISHFGFLAVK